MMALLSGLYMVMVVAACWCAVALLVALGWHLLRATIRSRSDDPSRGGRR